MTTAAIGLFYGSSTCYTEIAAEKIQQQLGAHNVDLFNIDATDVSEMTAYNYLIMGIPTWDYGELQEDWEAIWEQLDSIDFSGRSVALFGLGDQVGYPEWYQDAMGYLWAKLTNLNATLCGYWPIEGHEFEASKALTSDGQAFVGLALDEENQFELSEQRIERWCNQVLEEFNLQQLLP